MTDAGAAIDEAAASWAVRLDAGPLREDEQRALQEWLESNPRHHGALIRARAHWADLERLGALAGASESEGEDSAALERLNRRKFLGAGLAAATAGALGVALFVYKEHGERFQTDVGEMRRIALTDGSTLVLNTATQALVTFGKARRVVNLIEGEALFEVAHDVDRPFIVQVANVRVRAVGTVFTVRLRGEEVDVTVSEGAVDLDRALSNGPGEFQRVRANEQSVVVPTGRAEVKPLGPEVLRRRLAWLDGMVAFDGEPLSLAVAEVNRHSRRKIVIDDPELKAQPIVGRFRAADAEGFCRVAAVALGATAVDEGNTIHLRP